MPNNRRRSRTLRARDASSSALVAAGGRVVSRCKRYPKVEVFLWVTGVGMVMEFSHTRHASCLARALARVQKWCLVFAHAMEAYRELSGACRIVRKDAL